MNIESVAALVRRHRKLIVISVLLAALAGALFSKTAKVEYLAKSIVLLKPNDSAADITTNPSFTQIDFERYATNEVALAQSRAVQDRAAEALGVPSPSLDKALTVTHEAQSDLLTMVAASAGAERSVQLANAFADAYLAERKSLDGDVLSKKAAEVDAQITDTNAAIADLEAQIAAAAAGSAQQNALIKTRDASVATLTNLAESKTTLSAAATLNRGSGEVIERAETSLKSAGLRLPVAVVGGAFLGLLVALGASAIIEQLAPIVRSREDIQGSTPLLGEIPFDAGLHDDPAGLPAIVARKDARFAAAIRALRTRVRLFGDDEAPVGRIVVTSPRVGAGATTVAVNLAAAIAQSRIPTVLVSANLRDPEADRLLGFEPDPSTRDVAGLAAEPEVVTSPRSLGLFRTEQDLLRLLAAGDPTGNPSEVVASSGMRHVLTRIEEFGSFAVIDAPPVLDYPDAAVLAATAALVLLVVSEGDTRQADLRDALAALSGPQLPPVGVVLNRAGGG